MLGVTGWKTIVGVLFGALAVTLPQLKDFFDPKTYQLIMIVAGFFGTVLTGLGIAHKVEKGAAQIATAQKPSGNQSGKIRTGALLFMAIASLLFIMMAGCDFNWGKIATPSSNIDADQGPVCDRPDFAGSLICDQLRAHGIANAEDARDLILDANDVALLFDAYTVEQLSYILDEWDKILDSPVSYAVYISGMMDDTTKAKALSNILKRRFGFLLTFNGFIKEPDIRLLKLLNLRIRESVGIK